MMKMRNNKTGHRRNSYNKVITYEIGDDEEDGHDVWS